MLLSSIFLVLVLLSTIFSKYHISALFGVTERYEGMFVIFCYMILFMATIDCARTKIAIKSILFGIILSAFFIFMIGFSQFLGKDFWISDLGKKIIFFGYDVDSGNVKPVFDSAYSTLYNPNCLGLYSAMILPVAIAIMINFFYKKRNIYLKILSLIFVCLAFINLFASKSTGGLTGFICALFFMCCIFLFDLIKTIAIKKNNNNKDQSKKTLFITFCSFVFFISLVLLILSTIIFVSPVKNMLQKFSDRSIKNFFKDINFKDNNLEITYRTGKIKLEYKKPDLNLYENNRLLLKNINQTDDAEIYSYNQKTLEDLKIIIIPDRSNKKASNKKTNKKNFMLKINNIKIRLEIEKDKLFLLDNKNNKIDFNIPIERSKIFDGHELFASSRGYIWSRTIPLIKKNIFIGSGPDTFVFSFPQNDIFGKLKFHDSPYIIIDKPHNFYLQTIINTGLISLIVLLLLFIYYFFVTFRFFIENISDNKTSNKSGKIKKSEIKLKIKSEFYFLQVGLSSGILGYLVASMGTDSVVSVAPVFWILLGLSFAIIFFKDNKNRENLFLWEK